MEKSSLYRAEQICEPHCVGVICVVKRNRKLNLTPVTHWHTFGDEVPYLSFSLKNNTHTAFCLMRRREFTFSVTDVSLAKEVNLWGHRSGLYKNKLESVPAEIQKLGGGLYAPVKSCIVFCCAQKQFVEFGDRYLFNCEITETYVDEHYKPLFAYDSCTALGGVIRPKSVKNDLENTFKRKKDS